MRLRIAGLIRFSYPSLNGFRRTDREDPVAGLMVRSRLEARFELFERLTVPSLAAQTDPDFDLAVLIGEALPGWARERLAASLAAIPRASIVALPVMRQRKAIARAFGTLRPEDDAAAMASFRLDDDDALAVDYVARLRDRVLGAQGLVDGPHFSVSFARGIVANLRTGVIYDAIERLPVAAGTAVLARPGCRSHAYSTGHRYLPQHMDHFSSAAEPMWIRGVHADNDSPVKHVGRSYTQSPGEIAAALARRFHIGFDDLRAMAAGPVPPAGGKPSRREAA